MNSFSYFLVGPNGSGKTAEFNYHQAGKSSMISKVFVNEELFNFSFISQSTFNIYASANVNSSLMVPQILAGINVKDAQKNVVSLLADYGLESVISRKIGELSGGENQLVNIFIGLLIKKHNIYIDDPFGMLDYTRTNTLIDQINILTSTGLIKNLILNLSDSHEYLVNRFNRTEKIINTIPGVKDYSVISDCLCQIFERMPVMGRNCDPIVIENFSFDERIIGHKTVDGLNFKFSADNMYLIKGQNGRGKSLLLAAINGTLPPKINVKKGRIIYKDKKLQYRKGVMNKQALQKATFLFLPQNCHYLFQNYVASEVFKEKMVNITEQEMRILENNGVIWHRPTIEASLGEMRFFTITLALLSFLLNPSYQWLLLDEPDSFLDRNHKSILLSLLKLVSKKGKGLIVVSHDHELFKELIPLEL